MTQGAAPEGHNNKWFKVQKKVLEPIGKLNDSFAYDMGLIQVIYHYTEKSIIFVLHVELCILPTK